jgi:hypothetical protein
MKSVNEPLRDWLSRVDPDGSRYLFNGICKKWAEIVGPETAELVKPLGRRNSTLILGAQDSIVIQEISFLSDRILELINAFCGSDFFDKVRVELLKGRAPLDKKLVKKTSSRMPVKKPENLGCLKKDMDHDSPVARCYAKYLQFFGQDQDGQPGNNFTDSK